MLRSHNISDIIQGLVWVALDYLSFCFYKNVCDYLKGLANHDKIMLRTAVLKLLRVSMRYIFKRTSLDPNDYRMITSARC